MGLGTWLQKKGKIQKVRLIDKLQDFDDRITALEGGEPEPEPTRDISVTVMDGGAPLEYAVVIIGDIVGTTGSAGGCSLKNVSDGKHPVIIAHSNSLMGVEIITVSEELTSFTFIYGQE